MLHRRTAQLSGYVAVALALGGCAGSSADLEPGSPSPSQSAPSSSPSPSSTPSASPSEGPSQSPSPSVSPATITFSQPAPGSAVSIPFSTGGTANTFESALVVDVLDSAGAVQCVRHVMATSGSGTTGTWVATLTLPQPPSASAPVTLRAYEISPQDGSIINLVQQPLTVLPDHPDIWMTSPRCGAVVSPGASLAVTGFASVFEATLNLEVRDSSGAVVAAVIAMTLDGGAESPFSAVITIPADTPSGFYDLVAFNFSAKDGAKENEFPVQLSIRS